MKKILVTGGAGFIGSHVSKELKKSGYYPIILDNLSTGLKSATSSGELVIGDLNSITDLDSVFSKHSFQAVMHFAGSIEVAESVVNPEKYYLNNLVSTLNLLNAMKKYYVTNIVFSSTAAVYGLPQEVPIKESHPLNPINPYGRTKFYVEQILKDYSDTYNLKYIILRYFNAAGADINGELGENHEPETHLIPRIAQAALRKKETIAIFGQDYNTPDGTCIRDYVHVTDLAKAHTAALDYLLEIKQSNVFNLGSENGFSVREIINAAKKIFKVNYNDMYKFDINIAPRRNGDPDTLIASSQKAKKYLGWESTLSIEDMLETTIRWELSKSCATSH